MYVCLCLCVCVIHPIAAGVAGGRAFKAAAALVVTWVNMVPATSSDMMEQAQKVGV
jgi:hypothetical protein